MAAQITIISDWSKQDYYVASVQAAILSDLPNTNIINITHNIQSHNIVQAAFILRAVYKYFPKGSIHIIAVSSETKKDSPHCIVMHNGHYFIGSDNGIFALLFSDNPETIIHLQTPNEFSDSSFPELSIFTKLAIFIARGGDILELGIRANQVKPSTEFEPVIEKNRISGRVIYIDSYGNAITNISKKIWKEQIGKMPFELFVNNMNNRIDTIHVKYSDVREGNIIAIFNSLGLLEIAQREGNIAQLLKLDTNSEIFAECLLPETGLFT
jgi:hypothetical protein